MACLRWLLDFIRVSEDVASKCQQAWRRGYYVAVTFDEQLGVVLDGLPARNRERDTVVVFHDALAPRPPGRSG